MYILDSYIISLSCSDLYVDAGYLLNLMVVLVWCYFETAARIPNRLHHWLCNVVCVCARACVHTWGSLCGPQGSQDHHVSHSAVSLVIAGFISEVIRALLSSLGTTRLRGTAQFHGEGTLSVEIIMLLSLKYQQEIVRFAFLHKQVLQAFWFSR